MSASISSGRRAPVQSERIRAMIPAIIVLPLAAWRWEKGAHVGRRRPGSGFQRGGGERTGDSGGHLVPAGSLLAEAPPAGHGQLVVLRLPVVVGDAPLA